MQGKPTPMQMPKETKPHLPRAYIFQSASHGNLKWLAIDFFYPLGFAIVSHYLQKGCYEH